MIHVQLSVHPCNDKLEIKFTEKKKLCLTQRKLCLYS